jgi:hypothetical protein
MRTLGIIVASIALLVVGSVVWYKIAYPTYTYRLRLTVEIQANGDAKTGSSVIEVEGQRQPDIGGAPPISYRYRGDAVFIDLGDGQSVVATLGFGANGNGDFLYSLAPTLFHMATEEIASKPMAVMRADLPQKLIPTLITFADLSDPKTARVLQPYEFEQVFGSNVHFKSAWVEVTADPVTRGIEKKLPWLARMKAEGLGSRIEARPGRFTVNVPYFTRGR